MKLLTAAIIKKLPPLYSQDGKDPADVKIIVKFFSIVSEHAWYVTEGEVLADGDVGFFGLVRARGLVELGYFNLSEFKISRGGVPIIERDMHFGNHTLAEAKKERI